MFRRFFDIISALAFWFGPFYIFKFLWDERGFAIFWLILPGWIFALVAWVYLSGEEDDYD